MHYLDYEIETAIKSLRGTKHQDDVAFADRLVEHELFMTYVRALGDEYDIKVYKVAALLHLRMMLGVELEQNRRVTQ